MKKNPILKHIAAGAAALAFTGSVISAFPINAAGDSVYSADNVVDAVNNLSGKLLETAGGTGSYQPAISTYTVDNPQNLPNGDLPEKFDLRDVDGRNYITPVKLQDPYGTCWAFAATAAAESDIAANLLDIDMNTATDDEKEEVDFSERHLAWFTLNPLTENTPLYKSQAGEGLINRGAELYLKEEGATQQGYNDLFFNTGGVATFATSLYSSYQGPVSESLAPYHSDENALDGLIVLANVQEKPDSSDMQSVQDVAKKRLLYSNISGYMPVLESIGAVTADGEPRYYPSEETTDTSWWEGPGWYVVSISDPFIASSDGTWAVDESLRFQSAYQLKQSNILPSPCTTDENGAYKFNKDGLNAIKSELMKGRAISVYYSADQSMPGDTLDDSAFMNFVDEDGNAAKSAETAAYWCQYTYDRTYVPSDPESINKTIPLNHAVTIVGYDDTIPKEYFNDPNGTIGGDGAFIVKNSWGDGDWGNAGTGYFYLSYYDQSISGPESFSFEMRGNVRDDKIYVNTSQMYDLMPVDTYDELTFGEETAMVNVFTADSDMILTSVGYTAITCNEQVTYDIYLLDEEDQTPEGKESVSHLETAYQYGGFQRSDLETPVELKEGQKYAVQAKVQREDGNYGVGLKITNTEECLLYFVDLFEKEETRLEAILEDMLASGEDIPEEKLKALKYQIYINQSNIQANVNGVYGNAVVNHGESLLRVGDNWIDWADVQNEKDSTEFGKYCEFDNFGIKAYGESEMINLVNEVTAPQESYSEGDEVACAVTVKNNLSEELGGIVLYLDGERLTELDFQAGESKTVEYTHTITAEDLEKGSFETNVSANLEYETINVALYNMDKFSKTALIVPLKADKTDPEQPETTTTAETAAETTTTTAESGTTTEITTTESETATETTTAKPDPVPSTKDYAPIKRFAEMSRKDYQKKNGGTVTADAVRNDDGTVTVTIKDKNGNTVDTYILDAKTGIGENSKGEEVNLPQTGTTNPAAAAAATGAAGAVTVGAYLIFRSIKKKDEE